MIDLRWLKFLIENLVNVDVVINHGPVKLLYLKLWIGTLELF